jgi:UDP-N-acetylglucosamine transferase subunit ALG13
MKGDQSSSANGVPTVLATVGTDHHPFDRLVEWVDSWHSVNGSPQTSVLIQTGASRRPRAVRSVPYLAHEELERLMAGATAIVCHGGPGTIIGCMTAGKKPIVVPRTSSLGEHVDDHQVRFARRLGKQGYVFVAEDQRTFDDLLTAAVSGSSAFAAPVVADRVADSVAAFDRLIRARLGVSSAVRPPST